MKKTKINSLDFAKRLGPCSHGYKVQTEASDSRYPKIK